MKVKFPTISGLESSGSLGAISSSIAFLKASKVNILISFCISEISSALIKLFSKILTSNRCIGSTSLQESISSFVLYEEASLGECPENLYVWQSSKTGPLPLAIISFDLVIAS